MDSSGSIVVDDPNNWGLLKDFMVRFVRHLTVGQTTNHFATVRFSTSASLIFDLGRYFNERDVINSILSIRNDFGETNTAAGLRMLREQVFGRNGDRPNFPNIAIVLTDGVSTSQGTAAEAQRLKDTGALVIAVGITNNVNVAELNAIASGPDFIIRSGSFIELEQQLEAIIERACRLIEEPLVIPPGTLCIQFHFSLKDHLPWTATAEKIQCAICLFSCVFFLFVLFSRAKHCMWGKL